jgi:hypothetical protein
MNKDIFRRIVQVISILLMQGFILLACAGTLKWNWAWIFISTGVIILVINFLVLPREVMEERGMSFLVLIIFIIRTALEDKTLLRELEGYGGYSQKVKYRLFPFIW